MRILIVGKTRQRYVGVSAVWMKRGCGCRNNCRLPIGSVLITLGAGILLAYIIPYYILITLLGVALVLAGICCLRRK